VFPEKSVMVYAKWDVIPMVYDFEDFVLGALSGSDTRYCNGEAIIEKDASLEGNQYLYFKNVGRNSLRFNSPNSGMCFLESGEYTVTFKYKFATSTEKLQLGVNRFSTDAIGSPAYKDVGADISNSIYVHDSSAKADKNGWYTGKFEFSVDDISDGKNTLAFRNGATGRDGVSSPVYIDDVVIRRKGVTYNNLLGYDTQGGTFCETEYVEIGDVVTLPKSTKEGYRFIGWSYDKEGFQQIEGETITVESSYTKLYADWYKIPEPGDMTESETNPEQDPNVDKNQQGENQKGDFFSENIMLVVVGASTLVLIAVAVTIVVVVKKNKKSKQEVKEKPEE
ncbi:MAG: InlB B-repeat-containing protein, partial [Clostridia bacterium]|nr:InlB B-repeat-containing protein [Clostridia bacterium]